MLGPRAAEIGLGIPSAKNLLLVASLIARDVGFKFGGVGMPEIVE